MQPRSPGHRRPPHLTPPPKDEESTPGGHKSSILNHLLQTNGSLNPASPAKLNYYWIDKKLLRIFLKEGREGWVCLNDRKWRGSGRSESWRGVEVVLTHTHTCARTRMQTQLARANVHTRVQDCMRFNTSSPLKHTHFHLSLSLSHTRTYTTYTHISLATCCMLMLIISQGRLMPQLSARQARQIQVLHRPPTHSDTIHGDRIVDIGGYRAASPAQEPSRNSLRLYLWIVKQV